jgi:hypothetical protein
MAIQTKPYLSPQEYLVPGLSAKSADSLAE